jgi:hypothetical protein
VLGARLFTTSSRPSSGGTAKTRVAVDSARLVRAIGEANARNGGGAAGGRGAAVGKPGSGLEIRGASSGTTVEVRELVAGTTSADVKVSGLLESYFTYVKHANHLRKYSNNMAKS